MSKYCKYKTTCFKISCNHNIKISPQDWWKGIKMHFESPGNNVGPSPRTALPASWSELTVIYCLPRMNSFTGELLSVCDNHSTVPQ